MQVCFSLSFLFNNGQRLTQVYFGLFLLFRNRQRIMYVV